jgi:hypothetical protein
VLTQGNFSLNSAPRIRNNKQQQAVPQYWALDAEKRGGFVFSGGVNFRILNNQLGQTWGMFSAVAFQDRLIFLAALR